MRKIPGVAFYGKVRIPTIGHKAAIDTAKDIAKNVEGKLTVGLSGAAEPLDLKTKKSFAQKIFNHPVNTGTPETKNFESFLTHLNKSHDELHLVAGSDRVPEYKSFIKRYNGRKDKSGNIPFHFKKVEVHTVGGERVESNRNPEKMSKSALVSSVSASKLEKLAKEGNWKHFKAYHPGIPDSHVRKVYTLIRAHHTLKEEVTRKELTPMLDSFVSFASDKLGLKSIPVIRYKTDDDEYNSFAAYNPSSNELSICTLNRHPMDIFRSVAHELVHHKQNENGLLGKDVEKEGETGSDIENEANSEAGKIMRWFAKEQPNMFAKSYVVETNTAAIGGGIRGLGNVTGGFKSTTQLSEGINDPGKLKAIFLAGGPGSGKDYVMKKTLAGEGLREINSDTAFEFLMRKHGLNLKMPKEESVERDIVRGIAKSTTKEKERLAIAGRLGLIINGTADDIEKIKRIKSELEDDGYETMMVFVNTSNEVSRQRNFDRGQAGNRKVPDGTDENGVPDGSKDIRQEKWNLAQKNIGEFQKIFGNDKFTVIDNTLDIRKATSDVKEKILTNENRIRRMAQQFIRAENTNPNAKKWIEREAEKRDITQYTEPKITKSLSQIRNKSHEIVSKPSNELMVQARRLGLSYYGFGRFGRKVGGVNKVMYHSKDGKLVRVQINEDLRQWFKEKWVRFDTKGNIKGDCAREPGEGKPKCRPLASAVAMDKEERAKSARRKRRKDPVANRSGKGNKPIMVKTESVQTAIDKINRNRRRNNLMEKNIPTSPELWSKAKSLARSKFDVYPSAYANGWAAKWYKSKGGGWKSVDEGYETGSYTQKHKNNNRIRKKITHKLAENVNEKFMNFMEEHGAGDWGTPEATKKYMEQTPGQEQCAASMEFVSMANKKKNSLAQEEKEVLGKILPIGGGLGPEITQYRPFTVTGFAGLPLSESILSWANNPKTQNRFFEKYGGVAEQKLNETALMLEKAGCGMEMSQSKKSIAVIKETLSSAPYKSTHGDMSPIANQNKDEQQLNERGADSKGLYRPTEKGAGLTRKGAKHFGVKTAVTTPPSKLDPKGKAAKRRKSFCARMGGMRGPMKDEKGRPTRKAMSLRRWNCEE